MERRGIEDVVFCINRYMEGLVKCIAKHGGDIIKFISDALIVVWPKKDDKEDMLVTVQRSIQCTLEMQQELNNQQIMKDFSRLSVKVFCVLYIYYIPPRTLIPNP